MQVEQVQMNLYGSNKALKNVFSFEQQITCITVLCSTIIVLLFSYNFQILENSQLQYPIISIVLTSQGHLGTITC